MPTFTGNNTVVISNLPNWAAFFKKLVQEMSKKPGSVFNQPTVNFSLKVDNWAATEDANGTEFFIYDALDTGRKAFSAPKGKAIAFLTTNPNLILSKTVRKAAGYNISQKATAQISSQFDSIVNARFDAWAIRTTADRDVLPINNQPINASPTISHSFSYNQIKRRGKFISAKKAFKSSKRQSLSTQIQIPIVSGKSANPRDIPVLSKGSTKFPIMPTNDFQSQLQNNFGARKLATQIINKSSVDHAAILNRAQEAARAAGLRATFTAAVRGASNKPLSVLGANILSNNGPAIGPEQIGPNDPLFNKFIRLPNWGIVSAIFLGIAKDNVVPLIQNSPSRKFTGRFKLVYANGTLGALTPASGGSLRGGFVLLKDANFDSFITRIGA